MTGGTQGQGDKAGTNSYRTILKSSSIIGGASVANVVIGIVRMKIAAIQLGPSGLGLIGLLQSLMTTSASISSLGLTSAGTRQVAEAVARNDQDAVQIVRRALFWGTIFLAVLGSVLIWSFRQLLADLILEMPALSGVVGALAIGVAATVAASSQTALLNGLRRLKDLAQISAGGSILATAVGIIAILVWGSRGIAVFVLAAPISTFLLGLWFVSRLPRTSPRAIEFRSMVPQWRSMARLGAAFMVTGVLWSAGHLLVRVILERRVGSEALGLYQATWLVAMNYLGLVLSAMGTDYYPRLTGLIQNHERANSLINEQTEVALLLAAPLFVLMLGISPWLLHVLYSARFEAAATVLRWQVLGDVLKVASWPLGYVLMARGDGRMYLAVEALAVVLLVALTYIGSPIVGINAAGIAYLGLFVVYLPVVYWLARRATGFRWQRLVSRYLVAVFVVAAFVFVAAHYSKWIGAVLGVAWSVAFFWIGLVRLGHKAELSGPVGRLSTWGRTLMVKKGLWRE